VHACTEADVDACALVFATEDMACLQTSVAMSGHCMARMAYLALHGLHALLCPRMARMLYLAFAWLACLICPPPWLACLTLPPHGSRALPGLLNEAMKWCSSVHRA